MEWNGLSISPSIPILSSSRALSPNSLSLLASFAPSLSLKTLEIVGAIIAVLVRARRVRGVRVGVVDRAIRSPSVLYLSAVLSTSEGWSRSWRRFPRRRLIRVDVYFPAPLLVCALIAISICCSCDRSFHGFVWGFGNCFWGRWCWFFRGLY